MLKHISIFTYKVFYTLKVTLSIIENTPIFQPLHTIALISELFQQGNDLIPGPLA